MKDYSWLAVFSVFTLVVGILFTYGNAAQADTDAPPVQVYIISTTTPAAPIIIQEDRGAAQMPPPVITVNVMIATSSLTATAQTPAKTSEKQDAPSRTYYVTNNSYTTQEPNAVPPAEIETVTLSVAGVYDAITTPIVMGETVLELLTRLDAANSALDLSTQDYGDMGVLVTGMGGLTNGTDGKYWQYQVDGVVPMVGADQYELEDGEVVVWEFKGF